ncbi:MAG: P-loop NTPase, partial [Caulobacteraceae bacterium]
MAVPDKDQALAALERVIDPRSGKGLVSAGLVQGFSVGEGRAGFMLEVTAEDAALYAPVREAAEKALRTVAGVLKAQVVLTAASRSHGAPRPSAPPGPGVSRVRKGASLANDPRAQPHAAEAEKPEHVRRVVAVASGKGGVGKSTVAVNLACAFVALGLRAGLLDADVYGPSAPRMLGVDEQPLFEDGKLTPLAAHGVKVMS